MTANMQMEWQALTAYTALAVVIPTTFGGHTWQCTTAGTSGATEPTWPNPGTGVTTITDGTVTWTERTGFRQALSSGILAFVQTFATANPTMIRSLRPTRPRSFTNSDMPCFFLGDMNETIAHANGVRQRTFTGLTAYWVDELSEQQEFASRADFMADAMVEVFTANYHGATSGIGIVQHVATNDFEFPEGSSVFPALQFLFSLNTSIAEGRS